MKKKTLMLIVIAIITFLLSTLTVLAMNENLKIQFISVNEEEINTAEEVSKEKNEEIANFALEFLTKNVEKSKTDLEKNESFKMVLYNDNIENESYYKVQGEGVYFHIKDNGTIITYLNTKPLMSYDEYSKRANLDKYNDKEILMQKAVEIFKNKELAQDAESYSFKDIKLGNSYFPTAWFESEKELRKVFFAFNPETLEILNLGNLKEYPSQNNEIAINKEEAKEIAAKKIEKTIEEITDIKIDAVIPNEFFMPIDKGTFYKKIEYKRNAYIVTFSGQDSLQIYVDVTTGEVIGGDGLW